MCSCGRNGLGETMCEMVPLVCSDVASKRQPCLTFTSRPYSRRKSAPMIGVRMSAMTKIQRNKQCRPKSSVREHVPYVGIEEALTAQSSTSCWCFWSAAVGGMTLTSAPVSIRKWQPVCLSVINNRQLVEWPATLVTKSKWPSLFPPACRGTAFGSLITKLPVIQTEAIVLGESVEADDDDLVWKPLGLRECD